MMSLSPYGSFLGSFNIIVSVYISFVINNVRIHRKNDEAVPHCPLLIGGVFFDNVKWSPILHEHQNPINFAKLHDSTFIRTVIQHVY